MVMVVLVVVAIWVGVGYGMTIKDPFYEGIILGFLLFIRTAHWTGYFGGKMKYR